MIISTENLIDIFKDINNNSLGLKNPAVKSFTKSYYGNFFSYPSKVVLNVLYREYVTLTSIGIPFCRCKTYIFKIRGNVYLSFKIKYIE